ncbi:hypothetical protein KLEP7_gp107 [Pseudaeromonas phage vB_PpeM_ KLEP7]|nr:hypothetical protein KLEP7_gp107 [Pseudaeromonas phage vB_PpeM_ KLEP7]
MGKLILKGLIKKKWVKVYQSSNLYLVQDYNKNERRVYVKTQQGDYALILGYYENNAWYSLRGFPTSFSKYFLDWQNPSKNEIILFELETGLIYIDYYLGLRTWSYEE